MGQISIRLSNADEVRLKKLAVVDGVTLAEYCRRRILGVDEHMVDRLPIDIAVENLQHQVTSVADCMVKMGIADSRSNLYYQEFMRHFLCMLFTKRYGEDVAIRAWELADESARKAVEQIENDDVNEKGGHENVR